MTHVRITVGELEYERETAIAQPPAKGRLRRALGGVEVGAGQAPDSTQSTSTARPLTSCEQNDMGNTAT